MFSAAQLAPEAPPQFSLPQAPVANASVIAGSFGMYVDTRLPEPTTGRSLPSTADCIWSVFQFMLMVTSLYGLKSRPLAEPVPPPPGGVPPPPPGGGPPAAAGAGAVGRPRLSRAAAAVVGGRVVPLRPPVGGVIRPVLAGLIAGGVDGGGVPRRGAGGGCLRGGQGKGCLRAGPGRQREDRAAGYEPERCAG